MCPSCDGHPRFTYDLRRLWAQPCRRALASATGRPLSGFWPRRSVLAPPTGQVPTSAIFFFQSCRGAPAPSTGWRRRAFDPVETLLHHRLARSRRRRQFSVPFRPPQFRLWVDLVKFRLWLDLLFSPFCLRRLGPGPAYPGLAVLTSMPEDLGLGAATPGLPCYTTMAIYGYLWILLDSLGLWRQGV